MTTRGDRSNEIQQQQQKKNESATSSSSEEAEAGYSGYVTSITPPADPRSQDNRNGSSCLPSSSSPPPFLPVSITGGHDSGSSIDSHPRNQPRERAQEEHNGNSPFGSVPSVKGEALSMPQTSSSSCEQRHYQQTIGAVHPSPSPSPSPSSSAALSPPRAVRMSTAAETLGAGGSGGNSSNNGTASVGASNSSAASGAAESEDAAAWRNFCYEHPLHAATSAMLNLGGANALGEDGTVNSVGGSSTTSSSILIPGYDQHHYVPYSTKAGHHHQHSASHTHPLPPLIASGHVIGHHKDDKSMNEIWPSGMGGSHSTAAEDSPGGTKDTGAGHQQQQSSVVSEADIYPLVIKKEPEDLTRRNLRQHQQHQHVIHQQHHSDSRIMCTNTNNSNGGGPDKSGDQQQQHSTGSVISRVLADGELVHEMIPRLESIAQSQHSLSDGRDPTGGSVIHIRRPLSSAHHDGEATALSSAVVLDLARAGQNQQQQQQYSTTSYSAGSSIQPVGSNNHGYDLSTGAGAAAVSYGVGETSAYTTISSSPSTALRQQQQQTTYATPTPVGSDPFYRDYFNNNSSGVNGGSNDPQQYARAVAQLAYSNSGEVHESAFVDRFIRGQAGVYKQQQQGTGLTVDLPSPDSGIGVDAVTPRDQSVAQQNFDYTELCHPGLMSGEPSGMDHHSSEPQHHHHHPGNGSTHGGSDEGSRTPTSGGEHSKASMSPGSGHLNSSRSRSWHDCNRQTEADKIQIPKVMNQYGFHYYLEAPISTSQRREDDRITYINKGQFYGITLEYIPDPERPIKNQTVKSMVMLVFREEKSPEDEAKAWQFWHGRQHSAKQRILDADTKNSVGLVGCIEEVSHNAICVYWNPLESSAKINIAVQCLSTDFSSQKGVKGLPLHLQIDTFDDPRDSTPVFHRGYCQVKVFCDKGAERKTRDEERRAAKRKIVVTGRNKRLEELYHLHAERSEFYHMADLAKPPALFTPDDHEKISASMDLPNFYGHDHERKDFIDSHASLLGPSLPMTSNPTANAVALYSSSPVLKRRKLTPPPCERVMIYVRQENELAFTPLHLVPPTSLGLLDAIESKYKLSASTINVLYRKNCKGILAKIDDDMLKHYCNEDLFILEITTSSEEGMYDVTLKELYDA